MKNLILRAAPLLVVLASTGCAAILNGTSQTIQANSAPSGATLRTDPLNLQFTTPASISLERKNSYVLTFTKEGYAPATFQLQKKLSGGMVVLDVLLTGLIGVVVDAATGAWYNLSPEAASVALERTSASTDGPDRIEVRVTPTSTGFDFASSAAGVQVDVHQR